MKAGCQINERKKQKTKLKKTLTHYVLLQRQM